MSHNVPLYFVGKTSWHAHMLGHRQNPTRDGRSARANWFCIRHATPSLRWPSAVTRGRWDHPARASLHYGRVACVAPEYPAQHSRHASESAVDSYPFLTQCYGMDLEELFNWVNSTKPCRIVLKDGTTINVERVTGVKGKPFTDRFTAEVISGSQSLSIPGDQIDKIAPI